MVRLLDRILEGTQGGLVTDTELTVLAPGSPERRHGLIHSALKRGDLIRIRRGLYCLAPRYRKHPLDPFLVAQRVYGPSYISFESALAYHGLIPEAVFTISSATVKRSREFKTPVGSFSFSTIPINAFGAGVRREETQGSFFLIATPLKAIVDYVHSRKLNCRGIEPLTESLRIDAADLRFEEAEIAEMKEVFKNRRVQRFLKGLERDLKL